MRAFGVVPQEPVDEEGVEASKIVSKGCSVVLDEVLGERPIESFDAGVHLRAARIRVEVGNAEPCACIDE